ncbi:uncharacterized protein LOC127748869 [Frankliniella occidentalis]|uniref:Uncharacterized protein LOC127748869 n=1 Tax=Frankliniella occidentalis TaxID=133901 RepID=A0A9C6TPC9_FRAOC|nr:uncharacterized protein LOC127748869 [Frankliniella occidentalis]
MLPTLVCCCCRWHASRPPAGHARVFTTAAHSDTNEPLSSAAQLLEFQRANMLVIVLVLGLMLSREGIDGKVIKSLIGPYISYGERFYMCPPDNGSLPWTWHLHATHFNPYKPKELQRLTGNVTFRSFPLDDNTWVRHC